MLIRFRVENFASLRDEVEFSLVASGLKDASDTTVSLENVSQDLLRVAVIYGPNASGKSTILQAMSWMRSAIVHSHRDWEPDSKIQRVPFLLNKESRGRPSSFALDFVLGGTRHQYGFVADDEAFMEEWLFAYPKGRKQTLFSRSAPSGQGGFKFSSNLSGENRAIASLTRPNSLFLSAAAQNNHEILLPIYRWFSRRLEIVSSESRGYREMSFARKIHKSGAIDPFALSLLTRADLGIMGVDVAESQADEKTKQLLEAVGSIFDLPTDAVPATRPEVSLRHRAVGADAGIPLPFDFESDGTRTFFGLIDPIVQALRSGGVLCIDELDASLHPALVLDVIRLFSSKRSNPENAQLIVTTHDTNILGSGLLRRDQIWFTEKELGAVTRLYSLTDYSPRRNENLERGYLQGRYGAIPFIDEDTPILLGVEES